MKRQLPHFKHQARVPTATHVTTAKADLQGRFTEDEEPRAATATNENQEREMRTLYHMITKTP